MQLNEILDGFGLINYSVTPFGNGLINTTLLVETAAEKFILQKINKNIFKSPEDIAFNTRLINNHLLQHHPEYLFTTPLQNKKGSDLVKTNEGFFRLFSFVKNLGERGSQKCALISMSHCFAYCKKLGVYLSGCE